MFIYGQFFILFANILGPGLWTRWCTMGWRWKPATSVATDMSALQWWVWLRFQPTS